MKKKAARNKTIILSESDIFRLEERLLKLDKPVGLRGIINKTINQKAEDALKLLPKNIFDLVILDPPYNLNKTFGEQNFKKITLDKYSEWLEQYLKSIFPLLKKTATVYICGDWKSSTAIELAAQKYFVVRNRITWERDKGRGAKRNWKNNSEDIWFLTVSDDYVFNLNDVKLKKRVIAPYRDTEGQPKDWSESEDGGFRLTHPSNIWSDISVPFWSMPENTEHPTQKPEKLIAKLILASSNQDGLILDPFLGSGTTSVVAKKLNRKYVGIEAHKEYALLAEKRIELADKNTEIQGYSDNVFWERNAYQFAKIKNIPAKKSPKVSEK